MATGVVKTFNESKGFGFITPTDGGKDVHVRSTAVQAGSAAAMKDGAKVEYTPGEGPKGPLATDVRVIPSDSMSEDGGCCGSKAMPHEHDAPSAVDDGKKTESQGKSSCH